MKRLPLALLAVGSLFALAMAQPAQPSAEKPAMPPGHPLPPGHPGAPVAPTWPKANPEDVASIDAILAAFYQSTGGEPNQPRQWDRYRSLFAPDARLIAARPGEGESATAMFLSVTNFVDANKTYFEKGGFYDKEVARRVETFGNIAHVWSTYESRHRKTDETPYVRGINSVQLLKDGDRWWIVNVFWDFERENVAIPEKYLKSVPN